MVVGKRKGADMFYKDDTGINVIQFGTGDIECTAGLLDLPDETIGSVGFIPQTNQPIGGPAERSKNDDGECKLETMAHTRLVFTKVESIDVLIEQLQKIKTIMIGDMV